MTARLKEWKGTCSFLFQFCFLFLRITPGMLPHPGSSIYFYYFYGGGWIQLADFRHSQSQHYFPSQWYQHIQLVPCPPRSEAQPPGPSSEPKDKRTSWLHSSLFPHLVLRIFSGPRLLAFACMELKFRSFYLNVKSKGTTGRLEDLGTFRLLVNISQNCIRRPDIFLRFKQRACMCLKLRMSTVKLLSSSLTRWMLTASTTVQQELPFTFSVSKYCQFGASQVALVVKNPPVNAGDLRDANLIPGLGRYLGGGHGNPLYFCLESPMDRETWWATVHSTAKSQTWLKRISILFPKMFPTLQTYFMTLFQVHWSHCITIKPSYCLLASKSFPLNIIFLECIWLLNKLKR